MSASKNKKTLAVPLHQVLHKRYVAAAKAEGMGLAPFAERLMALGWEVYLDSRADLQGQIKKGGLKSA